MIGTKQYFNRISKHRKKFLNLKLPYGNLETKDFPNWLKEIINITYKIGLSQIQDKIKQYKQNHRNDNGYNSYLVVYFLETINKKVIVNSAIHPDKVWMASLYSLFEVE